MEKLKKAEMALFQHFVELRKEHRMATKEELKQYFMADYKRDEVESALNSLLEKSSITTETAYGIYEMTDEEFEEMLIEEDEEKEKQKNGDFE